MYGGRHFTAATQALNTSCRKPVIRSCKHHAYSTLLDVLLWKRQAANQLPTDAKIEGHAIDKHVSFSLCVLVYG